MLYVQGRAIIPPDSGPIIVRCRAYCFQTHTIYTYITQVKIPKSRRQSYAYTHYKNEIIMSYPRGGAGFPVGAYLFIVFFFFKMYKSSHNGRKKKKSRLGAHAENMPVIIIICANTRVLPSPRAFAGQGSLYT